MIWEGVLEKIQNASVLDVATGGGSFLVQMGAHLIAPAKMIGIDLNAKAIEAANENYQDKGYEFVCMNGQSLDFESESFDIVGMSNSLHHFEQPEMILAEMCRVLKPGGFVLIYEMVRDGITPKQKSHVMLHDFWGKIDTELGACHNPTFSHCNLKQLLMNVKEMNYLGDELESMDETEESEEDKEEMHSEIQSILDRYIGLAVSNHFSNAKELKKEADQIMKYVMLEGFDSAPQYYYLMKKDSIE